MRRAAREKSFLRSLIVCLAGPLIWSAHFFGLYAGATLACAGDSPRAGGFFIFALAATAIAVSLIVGLVFLDWRKRGARRKRAEASLFMDRLALALAVLSLLAVVWTAFPALLIAPCALP